ncbi:MAG TPA: prolyl oligopeptidase family serine peptidase [Bdellovibrionota bacterium]|nr:prolyl oligopeptidase family serine peptidase [Bdellovibrionota bacterium]
MLCLAGYAQGAFEPTDAQLFEPDAQTQAWIEGHRQRVDASWQDHPITRELIERYRDRPQAAPLVLPSGSGGFHYGLHRREGRNLLVRVPLATLRAEPAYDFSRAEAIFTPAAGFELVGVHPNPFNPNRLLVVLSSTRTPTRRFGQELDLRRRELDPAGIVAENLRSAEWLAEDRILYLGHSDVSEIDDPHVVRFAQRGVRGSRVVMYGQQRAEILGLTDGRERLSLVIDLPLRFKRVLHAVQADGSLERLAFPSDVVPLTIHEGHLVLRRGARAGVADPGPGTPGSLLAVPLKRIRDADPLRSARVIWSAGRFSVAEGALSRGDWLVLSYMDDGSHYVVASRRAVSARASWKQVPILPDSFASILPGGDGADPEVYVQNSSYLHSMRTSRIDLADERISLAEIHRDTEFIDPSAFEQRKLVARSRDGAEVPYRIVYPKGTRLGLETPVVFGNYSGNYIPYSPRHNMQRSAEFWLARGGVFAFAHARGGPERGIEWMEAGMGPGLQKTVDDIVAAADDLIARRMTSSRRLGITGGSHGMTVPTIIANQRPELFRAMNLGYGLQDFVSYMNLGMAARWREWYGLPWVPEQRAWLERLSPLQNLPRAPSIWPAMFLQGGAVDPNVHPVNTRLYARDVSRMSPEIWFHEGPNTGHGTNPDAADALRIRAMTYAFLWEKLAR